MKTRSIVFVLILVLAPAVLAADFGVRAGQYRDTKEEFVGVEMVVDAGVLNVNPNLEYSLEDNITSGTANLDVTLDIGRFSVVTPYLGAGAGILYIDDDVGEDETDIVGNLIGGVQLDFDFLKPYAQLKYRRTLEDGAGDDIAVTIGLRF